MNEQITIAIVLPIFFGSLVFVVYTIVTSLYRTRRDRLMADVTSKLLEKLGAGAELTNFINSDAYKNLLSGPQGGHGVYATRILNTLQSGIVILCGGIGMEFVANMSGSLHEFGDFLKMAGGIIISIGAGFTISAGWSYFLLKRWGLIEEVKSAS